MTPGPVRRWLTAPVPLWTLLLLALLLVAACSSGGDGGGATTTTEGLPQCSAVFAEGAVVTQAQFDAGCMNGAAATSLTAINCTDGRRLASFEKAWAFIGDVAHVTTGEIAADQGYKDAYNSCLG